MSDFDSYADLWTAPFELSRKAGVERKANERSEFD